METWSSSLEPPTQPNFTSAAPSGYPLSHFGFGLAALWMPSVRISIGKCLWFGLWAACTENCSGEVHWVADCESRYRRPTFQTKEISRPLEQDHIYRMESPLSFAAQIVTFRSRIETHSWKLRHGVSRLNHTVKRTSHWPPEAAGSFRGASCTTSEAGCDCCDE